MSRLVSFVLLLIAILCPNAAFGQGGPMAAVASADNRFELFVASPTGIRHFWQLPGQVVRWNPNPVVYRPAPDPIDISPFEPRSVNYRPTIVAARDSGGRIMVAWIAKGHVYYASAPAPGASLGDGQLIQGTENVSSLAIARNKDGRLELFTVHSGGGVSSYVQESANAWSWSTRRNWIFRARDGTAARFTMISVTPHGDGRLLLVGLTKPNGSVVACEQPAPNMPPPPNCGAINLGGDKLVAIIARESIDHRYEIFARGSDGLVYQRFELAGGGSSGWRLLSQTPTVPPIQVVVNGDGRMEIIARLGARGVLHRMVQNPPNGFFSHWERLSPSMLAEVGPVSATTTPAGTSGVFSYSLVPRRISFSIEDLFMPGPDRIPAWSPMYNVHNPTWP